MTPEHWQQVKELLQAALEQDPHARAAFLDGECAGSPSLREEVESLIAFQDQAKGFLEPQSCENASQLPAGQVLDEKYRIDKLLGQGGMGAVYQATHLGTGRPVALKVIAPQFMANEQFVERFRIEARAAGLLRHPNVVNVTDFGFTSLGTARIAYLVMEYLDGCTLGEKLKQGGELPLAMVVDIIEQTCLAIDEAHRQGIIHRDLKPDNIWLEPNGRGGYNVKVLDFGLAKLRFTLPPSSDLIGKQAAGSQPAFADASSGSKPTITSVKTEEMAIGEVLDEEETRIMYGSATAGTIDPRTVPEWLTRAGMVLGTPLYMSPEQCHGEKLDARSDIYSLGVIAYQMLARETPFTGDFHQLVAMHNEMPPPPLNEKRPDISKAVSDLVLVALAKNPVDRPASATAFSTSLRAIVEGEAVIREQASELYRKHSSTFRNLSILIYVPFVIINGPILFEITTLSDYSSLLSQIVYKAYWLLALMFTLFANTVNTAACALVVERLRLSPAGRVQLLSLFSHLTWRLRTLERTALGGYLSILSRLLRFTRPRLRDLIDNSLYAHAVILEGREKESARERSRVLINRLRSVALPLLMHDILTGLIATMMLLPTLLLCGLISDELRSLEGIKWPVLILTALIPAFYLVFVHPPIAIALTLFYYRAREAGGEALDVPLNQYTEPADKPGSRRVQYMRLIAIIFNLLALLGVWWFGFKDRILIYAASEGRVATAKVLIITGANVTADDGAGNTPLAKAAIDGNIHMVRLFIAYGADVNARNNDGMTPLMEAAEAGNVEVVKVLLAAGAAVNAKTKDGMTALMFAKMRGNEEIARVLIAEGAEVNIVNIRENGWFSSVILGGEFIMGRDPGLDQFGNDIPSEQTPKFSVRLQLFFIGKYEVTNREYREFVVATGYSPPPDWQNNDYSQGAGDQPVTSVSWEDANAYCQWRSKKEGREYRLPTEEEWEFAARGPQSLLFTWGNYFEPNRANTKEFAGAPLPVTSKSLANDTSYFGVVGMVGNVSEWTSSDPKLYPGNKNIFSAKPGDKVVRGTNYKSAKGASVTTFRIFAPSTLKNPILGFRIVMSAGK